MVRRHAVLRYAVLPCCPAALHLVLMRCAAAARVCRCRGQLADVATGPTADALLCQSASSLPKTFALASAYPRVQAVRGTRSLTPPPRGGCLGRSLT